MRLVAISGSLREHSFNTQLLNAAAKFLPEHYEFEMLNISQLDHYNEDIDSENKPAAVVRFLESIENASVLLFASPEYNHSMSGVLKNAIDWASRPAFQSPLLNKPCGILTASKSPVGGARAQADLKNVLSSTLSQIVPATEYLLPDAHEKFNAEGELTDPIALRRLKRYVEGLITWANGI